MGNIAKSSRRQTIENAFKQYEYIDNISDAIIDSFSHETEIRPMALRDYISSRKVLSGTNYRVVRDPEITKLLFLEADEYLAKALNNLCSGCVCHHKGYLSWGEVTIYYSSFFAIHGLLRLQGKSLGTSYVLFPYSIRSPASIVNHEYVITSPIPVNGIHEDLWRKFFDTYSQNIEIDQMEYTDAIFFSDTQDIVLEVERRNRFNYQMFESYQEVFNSVELNRRLLFNLKSIDPLFFSKLTYYVRDADRKYIAKAALRIQLLHSLLYSIVEGTSLETYFNDRHGNRLNYLDSVLTDSSPIDRSCIEQGCLLCPHSNIP
ncbi:MAG TPA: hypothetical protein VJ406_00030 [Dehalococcoidia bacterium]|nr:MAG: hypothetical protein A2Z77_00145 [Chloroflexi bacterium RBG_13_51_36]HJX68600.1 hypothetical protein [Dehalococcoidia bacterium]